MIPEVRRAGVHRSGGIAVASVRRALLPIAIVTMALAAACVDATPFACDDDAQCVQSGALGVCQTNGFCSFADPSCDSGQRYGGLSNEEYAEQCVSTDDSQPGDSPAPPDPPPGEDAPPPQAPVAGCFSQLRAGAAHTCALRDDGAVYCWGDNAAGQTSAGAPVFRAPIQVNIDAAVAVAAGEHHSCAALATGQVWCWGRNHRGQLGDGSSSTRSRPAPTRNIDDAIALEVGASHSCALTSAGTVLCWGLDDRGQLGRGDLDNDPRVPAALAGVGMAVAGLTAGGTSNHSCAFVKGGQFDGPVLCWGDGGRGQLGRGGEPVPGDRLPDARQPTIIPGLFGADAISVGASHTCARFPGGAIRCAGHNGAGQLGDGSFTDRSAPVQLDAPPAIAVAAGGLHSCLVAATGDVHCWGNNERGQLGTPAGEAVPRPGPAIAGLGPIAAVAAGKSHTCALSTAGAIACWGDNRLGQLARASDDPAEPESPTWVDLPCP